MNFPNDRIIPKGREFTPFFCKPDRAKLFNRFTYEEYIKLNENETLTIEKNNYLNYVKFKWQTETSFSSGEESEMDGKLLLQTGYLAIFTNSLFPILKGDIVVLKLRGKELAFIVTEDPISDFIFVPKEIQTFTHLQLKKML